MSATTFTTQIGEGFAGDGADAAHINTVLGARGGPVETAWASALASPSAGHTPFLVVVRPGLALQPPTLFVNKASIANDRHGELTWGPAQAGVARGVLDALRAGSIDPDRAGSLLLITAVWVNPAAGEERAVYDNNARATLDALRAGAAGEPTVAAVLGEPGEPWNAYFAHASDGR
jgi:5,6,7,8-tetrahydromethanopterin hydro-lyase